MTSSPSQNSDPARRRLTIGIGISFFLHALVLSLQFGVPGIGLPGAPIKVVLRDAVPPPAPPPEPERQDLPLSPLEPSPTQATPGQFTLVQRRAPPPPQHDTVAKTARRISAPRAVPPDPVVPSRVITQDGQNGKFAVPLPRPEESVAHTDDVREAQDGSDDAHDASTTAPDAQAIKAAQLADAARKQAEADAQAAREAQEKQAAAEARRRETEQTARRERERLAVEDAARQERERLAVAEAQKREQERLAIEDAARRERERLAVEDAAKRQRERIAAEDAARLERERLAVAEAARRERERQAIEDAARRERERLAAEDAARRERERQAAEDASRRERERIAAEDAARRERDRIAAEQAARQERERAAAQAQQGTGAGPGSGAGTRPSLPANALASDAATRLREAGRGLDLLRGAPPRALEERERNGRRIIVGAGEKDVPLKMYVDSFRQKIERNGNLGYTKLALVRVDPVVVVYLRSDGSVEDIQFARPSGRPEVDEAVRRIVRLNARYAAFPPNIAAKFDVIAIRRVWSFDESLRILEEVQ